MLDPLAVFLQYSLHDPCVIVLCVFKFLTSQVHINLNIHNIVSWFYDCRATRLLGPGLLVLLGTCFGNNGTLNTPDYCSVLSKPLSLVEDVVQCSPLLISYCTHIPDSHHGASTHFVWFIAGLHLVEHRLRVWIDAPVTWCRMCQALMWQTVSACCCRRCRSYVNCFALQFSTGQDRKRSLESDCTPMMSLINRPQKITHHTNPCATLCFMVHGIVSVCWKTQEIIEY